MNRNLAIFPDSNFFFQCVDPAECPWSDISDATEIVLAVCRAVRGEIDNRKNSRGRVGSRAQHWTTILRRASRNGGKFLLRDERPRVILRLAPPAQPLTNLPAVLDLGRPDDRVIADILAQKVGNPESRDAVFFTDDGGAADTARHVGLQTIDIPMDEESSARWRLSPEPDASERKIRQLEDRLRAFESQAPRITCRLLDNAGAEVDHLALEIVRFEALGPSQIKGLIEKARSLHPMRTDFSAPKLVSDSLNTGTLHALLAATEAMRSLAVPGEEAVKAYTQREYPSWVKRLEKFFGTLHIRLERKTRVVRARFEIANHGSVSADGFVLTAEALAGLQFTTNDVEMRECNVDFPEAPSPPVGAFWAPPRGHSLSTLGPLIQPTIKIPDQDVLHRRRTDSAVKWQWDCGQLRHKAEPQLITPLVLASASMSTERRAALKVQLWARNLPEPEAHIVPVTSTVSTGDTHATACKIIDESACPKRQRFRRWHTRR